MVYGVKWRRVLDLFLVPFIFGRCARIARASLITLIANDLNYSKQYNYYHYNYDYFR